MDDNIEIMKDKFAAEKEALAARAWDFVAAEVTKACDANNWDFISTMATYFVPRGAKKGKDGWDNEIENETTIALVELVMWCDARFGSPLTMYKNGKWYPEA